MLLFKKGTGSDSGIDTSPAISYSSLKLGNLSGLFSLIISYLLRREVVHGPIEFQRGVYF